MRYLTANEVLYLHHRIVDQSGGSHGVRDTSLLEAALERPTAGIADMEFFPSLFDKAAATMDALIRNHPFVDGNKRTGMSAAAMLLELNGCQFTASHESFVEFAVEVATQHPKIEVIAEWLAARNECRSAE